jgi:hypothetical protein
MWGGESGRTCGVSPGGALRNLPLRHRRVNAIQIRHLMYCDTPGGLYTASSLLVPSSK